MYYLEFPHPHQENSASESCQGLFRTAAPSYLSSDSGRWAPDSKVQCVSASCYIREQCEPHCLFLKGIRSSTSCSFSPGRGYIRHTMWTETVLLPSSVAHMSRTLSRARPTSSLISSSSLTTLGQQPNIRHHVFWFVRRRRVPPRSTGLAHCSKFSKGLWGVWRTHARGLTFACCTATIGARGGQTGEPNQSVWRYLQRTTWAHRDWLRARPQAAWQDSDGVRVIEWREEECSQDLAKSAFWQWSDGRPGGPEIQINIIYLWDVVILEPGLDGHHGKDRAADG